MASSSTSDNIIESILLKSMDDEYYEVDESVAKMSRTIKHMIEDVGNSDPIPLPNVAGKILTKVIEYCYKHVDFINNSDNDASVKEELKEWDQNFLQVDQNTLFDLILAANYLDLKGLLDLSCRHVASMMKGKSPEEIRETFHIKNDYTPEQEEEVRKENAWAFE